MIYFNICFLIITNICVLVISGPASTGSHSHSINKERVSDGAYIPRDAHHIENGEHHTEFDHEAILGSTKEAEEFDHLSPEESKKRLAILLKKMDLNGDSHIQRHELKAWILRSFKNLSEEEAADRFEDSDLNGDNIVTWAEYVSDTYNMGDEEYLSKDSVMEEHKLMADDKVMFDAADANKDGKLDPNEFIVFNNPEEHPQMLPIILQQTLNEKDTNKDNVIDFQEFIGDKAIHHDKEWLIVEKEKFDKEYDKNGDGVLSGNEVLSWVVPSNDEIALEEVDHLFASTDDDHDDVLSFEEILIHYEHFVGSEATDFGEHLHNVHMSDEL
ncbi:reticulocalbin-2 [Ctenocephalides felis]|uniref:reticulocalbin-2 n=1 Tax=Ctenocephalides felis TaxID=7515 RepID=UPI000E6E435A|nr:reticulocalbin-2 [Ctenocephalides felis]